MHHWLFVNITFWSLLNFSIIHLSKRGPAPIENVGNHCGWSWNPGISGTSSRSMSTQEIVQEKLVQNQGFKNLRPLGIHEPFQGYSLGIPAAISNNLLL